MTWPKSLALLSLPILLTALGVGRSLAAPPGPAGAARQETNNSSGQARGIAALSWMAGSWMGNGLGGSVEEHWSAPAGGSMIGMFRLVQREATSFAQYMLIEEEQGGRVVLRFQHFNLGFEPWEKDGPLSFELVEAGPARAVFESPDEKQTPARLTYSARGEQAMSAVIESPQALGGPISFEIMFKRAVEED